MFSLVHILYKGMHIHLCEYVFHMCICTSVFGYVCTLCECAYIYVHACICVCVFTCFHMCVGTCVLAHVLQAGVLLIRSRLPTVFSGKVALESCSKDLQNHSPYTKWTLSHAFLS